MAIGLNDAPCYVCAKFTTRRRGNIPLCLQCLAQFSPEAAPPPPPPKPRIDPVEYGAEFKKPKCTGRAMLGDLYPVCGPRVGWCPVHRCGVGDGCRCRY
jgi:hypothetical protein